MTCPLFLLGGNLGQTLQMEIHELQLLDDLFIASIN
jgi:hypothetical protein